MAVLWESGMAKAVVQVGCRCSMNEYQAECIDGRFASSMYDRGSQIDHDGSVMLLPGEHECKGVY